MFFRAETYGFAREFIDYVKDIQSSRNADTVTGRALLEGKIIHIADVLADSGIHVVGSPKIGWLPHHARGANVARGQSRLALWL